MAHYTFEAPLGNVDSLLTTLIDETGYEYVDSHIYTVADGERPTGAYLFCILRDPDEGDFFEAPAPQGITPLGDESDLDTFRAWTRGDIEGGVDIDDLRNQVIQ